MKKYKEKPCTVQVLGRMFLSKLLYMLIMRNDFFSACYVKVVLDIHFSFLVIANGKGQIFIFFVV